jgi:hypothetical protein
LQRSGRYVYAVSAATNCIELSRLPPHAAAFDALQLRQPEKIFFFFLMICFYQLDFLIFAARYQKPRWRNW